MSIIHEALKKVQDNLDQFKGKNQTLDAAGSDRSGRPSNESAPLDHPAALSSNRQAATAPSPVERHPGLHERFTPPPATDTDPSSTRPVMAPGTESIDRRSVPLWLAWAACAALGAGLIVLVMLYMTTRPASDHNGGPRLEGVAVVNGETVALIGGEMYHVGDVYHGKKIIAIEWNEVALKDPTGRIHRLTRRTDPGQ